MSIIVFDTEVYRDYFLAAFKDTTSGKVRFFEMYDGHPLDRDGLKRALQSRHTFVSFNGINFDLPVLFTAIQCGDCAKVKAVCDDIIVRNKKHWQVIRERKIATFEINHIDLIEVAPGVIVSLKLYGGRMASPSLIDMPFHHEEWLTDEQAQNVLLPYCINDIDETTRLYRKLEGQIALRQKMSERYDIDLRSKSDAQIAETVIKAQLENLTGVKPERPEVPEGTTFKYKVPAFLSYTTDTMKEVLEMVRNADFVVTDTGGIKMPDELANANVVIGNSVFRMGIGGLHSSESSVVHIADDDTLLLDRDVASYYPAIILGQGLYPSHLGPDFLTVYKRIVDRRLAAKHAGDKVTADSLKITINGSFGKLGSKWSTLYSPDLMIQVTITGQLALLMLIEALELRGIRVVSGNTDGIVIYCRRDMEPILLEVIGWWEKTTGFNTEETRYTAVFSRDVNNYVALKEGGGAKGKGAFAPVSISKNPQNQICADAAKALLEHGTPVEETIRSCRDIRKFVTVRTVRGGAVQVTRTTYDDSLTPGQKKAVLLGAGWQQTVPGPLAVARFTAPGTLDTMGQYDYDVERAYRMSCGADETRYLGKVVRFYIGHSSEGALFYKVLNKSGSRNKVPGSDGACPVMDLPDEFPEDVDYDFYIREANDILKDIGATPEKVGRLLYGDSADLFV